MEPSLSEVLAVEHQVYMTKLGDLTKARDLIIEKIRHGSLSSAGRALLENREKLSFLRQSVELRVQLRAEYGSNDARLLTKEQSSALLEKIVTTVNIFRTPDQAGLAELESIKGRASAALNKLAVKSRWDEMKKDAASVSVNVHNSSGAIVNISSVVGDINSKVQILRGAGQDQMAEALDRLTNAVSASKDLAEMRNDVLQSLSLIGRHASGPPEQRQSGAVRMLYLGLATALSHAADVAQIWSVYGPQIASFFGFTG